MNAIQFYLAKQKIFIDILLELIQRNYLHMIWTLRNIILEMRLITQAFFKEVSSIRYFITICGL